MCCGVGIQRTLTLMTKLILGSDLIVILFWFYMLLILFLGSINGLSENWYVTYVSSITVTEEMFLHIFAAIMFVLVPLLLMLCFKA